MKKNKGVLPMCEMYTFNSITDLGEDIGMVCCDNCGSPLRYVVELSSSKGTKYNVGTECSKTLSEAKINNAYAMEQQIVEMKKIATVRNFMNKASNIRFYGLSNRERRKYIIIAGQSGKTIKRFIVESKTDIFKNENIEFITQFIDEIYESKKDNIIYDKWCWNDIFKYLDALKLSQQLNEQKITKIV